jgi:histidyl-tRNA synthetase
MPAANERSTERRFIALDDIGSGRATAACAKRTRQADEPGEGRAIIVMVPMPTFQAPRGTRDLLPEEAAAMDTLQAVVQARALRYGYPRISTPVIENRDVFVKGVGEGTDIVGYEMYEVAQRGEGGLALRPEGTAAVTRALLENGLHKSPQPIRFFYYEPMFRGQRPQLLRFRQFWQWGLECYGAPEPAADVEIIDFANGLFAEVGLTAFELEINTIGDEACQEKLKNELTEYFSKHREVLSPASQRRLDTNVLRILDSKEPQDRELIAGAPKMKDVLCDEDRRHFAAVEEGLTRLGIAYKVVDTLVRGLDYYTRTVSEFILTDPEYRQSGDIAVAAGGRYDGLVRRMGGPDLTGTGIAGGADVLYYALKKQGVKVTEEPKADVYVVSAQPDDVADRTQVANPLREAEFTVAIDYSSRPLDRQLESAIKHGARVAVIRGTDEARGGNLIVRDLVKKEQRVTKLAAVATEVGRHVEKHPRPRLWKPPTNPDEHEPGAAGEAPFLADPRD